MGLFNRLFASKPPSHDQFAKMVMNCIQKAGEKGQIIYDKEQFRLHVPEEDGTRLFLNNAYEEYNAAQPNDRDAQLMAFARSWFITNQEMPAEFEDVCPDLLPVVRDRAYYENAQLYLMIEGRSDPAVPQQPIGDHLVVALVYDLPKAMRSIGQEDLDRWGVTFYEALEVAKDNLRQLPHSFIGPQEGEGVYLSMTHDNYDASRLLLLDTIQQFQVKGGAVAMIPNRDTLIVTGSDDGDGLKGMLALAQDALKQPRPMSGHVLKLDGDEWIGWLPETTHPLYREFRTLQIQSFGQSCNEQKALLDKLHEKNGQDIFVASYMVMENQDTGNQVTFGVWSKSILTLLPRTDRIAFVQDGKDPLMADWERAVDAVGDLMKPLDIYPERFQVNGFPTDEQLAVMGAAKP